MTRSTIITLIVVAAFMGLVIYSSMANVGITCEVCMEFNGRRDCRTAAGESAAEARLAAQTTACGLIANGMDESIGCSRTTPESVMCSGD